MLRMVWHGIEVKYDTVGTDISILKQTVEITQWDTVTRANYCKLWTYLHCVVWLADDCPQGCSLQNCCSDDWPAQVTPEGQVLIREVGG